MKPSFNARLVNGPFEDPGLYVRFVRQGRALLFDCGFTTGLSVRDILKISDIFVSHAHVDHFIGLDSILRLHLKKETPLSLYGPDGFIRNVEGKLGSYTWNLVGDYPLVIEVSEVKGKSVSKAVFKAGNSFKREDKGTVPFDGVLVKDSFFRVKAVVLDHQVPCLGFRLEEDYHINIDKAKLNGLNLPVGPWLGEFKNALRKNMADSVFAIEGRSVTFSELREIANITKGQKISYIVDVLGSESNRKKIVNLAKGSDAIYIEAYFLHRDKDKAEERFHLTARQAGSIAGEAGAAKMTVFHFSPRYADSPEAPVKEAEDEFSK
ncbi:MAG TPA: MBL fold metallo-hydrolase [Nitrospirae bacterium]|nr:ribonuclease BN [bacterium BMS3Abin10]GBE38892.1 ribonuclease BN [bacterium BMS3Bbin08]HDH00224.1 MBL fold metallo-hydrolase [Nitrospirota bacterium]HDH49826.1 MBL fold metallo-hydrolase [Nitrospirota bacterium]